VKIVVLDGFTLNPGDLSWNGLESLGPCTVYDRTHPEEIAARAAQSEIVLTNKTELPREILQRLPKLRYVGVLATGYDIVDVQAARERNVPVTNVPKYATTSVVQMVFAHLMNLTLHVADHGRGVAAGRWTQNADFCYWESPLIELAGLTFGVVGFGQIGRAVAEVALAMGMHVVAYDVAPPPDPLKMGTDSVRFVGM
jgi:glycerate dehydrogenase